MSVQRCEGCSRLMHDEDLAIALVKSVFHTVPGGVLYAIEPPTECLSLWHEYCWFSQSQGGNA